jgi:hypothetical protein
MNDLSYLRDLGRLLDDQERVRIMNSNRIAAAEREYGSARPHLIVIQEEIHKVEGIIIRQLESAWKQHPLAPWAKTIPGAGPKLMSRLISEVGDPADRANPAKLWAYCGHGDPARRRVKGMSQEDALKLGNPWAKKRVWLLSNQFMKTRQSPYRVVYEDARSRANEDWTLGHQHAHALRLVGKQFLLDLWIEAWRLRTLATGEVPARRGGRRGRESQKRHQAARAARTS